MEKILREMINRHYPETKEEDWGLYPDFHSVCEALGLEYKQESWEEIDDITTMLTLSKDGKTCYAVYLPPLQNLVEAYVDEEYNGEGFWDNLDRIIRIINRLDAGEVVKMTPEDAEIVRKIFSLFPGYDKGPDHAPTAVIWND